MRFETVFKFLSSLAFICMKMSIRISCIILKGTRFYGNRQKNKPKYTAMSNNINGSNTILPIWGMFWLTHIKFPFQNHNHKHLPFSALFSFSRIIQITILRLCCISIFYLLPVFNLSIIILSSWDLQKFL